MASQACGRGCELSGLIPAPHCQFVSLKNWKLPPSRSATRGGTDRRSRSRHAAAASSSVAPEAAREPAPSSADLDSPTQFPPSYYDPQGRLMLKCLTLPELEEWCGSLREPPARRAMQLWRFMYYDRQWLRSLDDAPADAVQNGFSQKFRDRMRGVATLDGGLQLVSQAASADGTRKLVFRLTTGPGAGGQVETVIIPIVREAGTKARVTLCVSSQVGCAQGCTFCWTGKMGLLGNLTPGQIVEQVVAARRLLFEEDVAAGGDPAKHITPITNIVFMGMGEPMDNLPAVLPAIAVLVHPLGLHLSYNKITVSTVGLIPEMQQFAAACRAVLAVSLHGATDAVRDAIVPVNRRYPLAALVGALEEMFPKDKAAIRHGHHVLIEYIMLSGVNDRTEDAEALLRLLRHVRCKVNLIVFNPHEGTRYEASTPEAVRAFRGVLIQGGHVATVRSSRGDDTMAACGQLGNPAAGQEVRRSRREGERAEAAASS